ncbi:FAD-binding protein [Legionella jamestowniensis]|nr:FAD-binding protein [Legionella jamestowniensis]KTD08243.1 L-gulono-gamma-lactone oxidase [Legionella jamestowniensis]SFL97986.1 L-gulonolactone oxidase [Legionella jamestowniensis DSM 19215]
MPFATLESKNALLHDLTTQNISYKVKTWKNYMENVSKSQAVIVQVDSEEQVQAVMRAVKEQNKQYPDTKITVRATAGWADKKANRCCFPWAKEQEQRYNESFSFSDGSVADVIIRFSPKYQKVKKLGQIKRIITVDTKNPLDHLKEYEVLVTSGVQIAKLAQKLRDANLSLRTASMLSWASAVGLAGTGGHGTGRDEPAFSGQILSLKICDQDGEIREINADDPDFLTLCSAHSGALGIVLSMKMKAVEAFNLKETVYNFPDVKTMKPRLNEFLTENQYFSLIGIPCHGDGLFNQDKWQIRLWNYTEEARTKVQAPPYAADARSWAQELSVRVGDSIQEFLMDNKLKSLIPPYLLLAAATIMGTRGTTPLVDHENSITHYQVAFPKAMRDVSYILPVEDKHAGALLADVLHRIELLTKAAAEHGEFPITYAVYARYIKGSKGGLSTTTTSSEDEHVLAIDIVTHPDAPGIAHFEEELLNYFAEIKIKPRFHLGKNFPSGVHNYTDFLEPEAIEEYKKALKRWYGGNDELKASPFVTPYFEQMLGAPSKSNIVHFNKEKLTLEERSHEHDSEDCAQFLEKLIPEIGALPSATAEAELIKDNFISQCREVLLSIKESMAERESKRFVS